MGLLPRMLRGEFRAMVSGESPWPLFLCGPPGTGKTCAALLLLDYSGGLYHTAQSLAEEAILAAKGQLRYPSGRQISSRALFEELARTKLAVLDELGSREKVTDHAYEVIKRVLDDREGKPLVCISNLGLAQMEAVYDDRLTSRLAAGTVLELQGDDLRLKR